MSDAAKGVWAMVGACVIWGLSALFYRLLSHVPPIEVLAHRTLWSLVVFAGLLAVQGRLSAIGPALGTPRGFFLVLAASVMISINWFCFIFSVQAGFVVQSALGYYIFPLVTVALGALVLKEALSPAKRMAVALAAIAVLCLSLGLGVAPWISLILAVTFGLYGLIKRFVASGPILSVTGEVLLLAPIALAVLAWQGQAFGADWATSLLLIASGPLTAVPLMMFSYATKRAALSTIGLVQYLNPTLQFLIAVAILGEAVTIWHIIALALIWAGLALYSMESFKRALPPAQP